MWSLSLIMKKNFDNFYYSKGSPNLAHCLLMAFSDLEKRNHKIFLEKHYTRVHTNIEQKPSEASLTGDIVRRN